MTFRRWLLSSWLLCGLAAATEPNKPTPPTPQQQARARERFVGSYRYREGSTGPALQRRITEAANLGLGFPDAEALLHEVLETYPVAELEIYLNEAPAELRAAGFYRILKVFESRGIGRDRLRPAVRRYLWQASASPGRPPPEVDSVLGRLVGEFFADCGDTSTRAFLQAYFCRRSPVPAESLRTTQLPLWNGPETLSLSESDRRTLSGTCRKLWPKRYSCPRNYRLPEDRASRREPPATAADRVFACTRDEDCVPIRNGCGLARVFAGSRDVHDRFRCVCKRGPTVNGCFPEANAVGVPEPGGQQ